MAIMQSALGIVGTQTKSEGREGRTTSTTIKWKTLSSGRGNTHYQAVVGGADYRIVDHIHLSKRTWQPIVMVDGKPVHIGFECYTLGVAKERIAKKSQ